MSLRKTYSEKGGSQWSMMLSDFDVQDVIRHTKPEDFTSRNIKRYIRCSRAVCSEEIQLSTLHDGA